jgi:hypothetical protein
MILVYYFFFIRLVSRFLLYRYVARASGPIFLYVNFRTCYIYMSRLFFEIQMCYMLFLYFMMMMSMFPICCDRMYEMFMYVYLNVIYASLTPC